MYISNEMHAKDKTTCKKKFSITMLLVVWSYFSEVVVCVPSDKANEWHVAALGIVFLAREKGDADLIPMW